MNARVLQGREAAPRWWWVSVATAIITAGVMIYLQVLQLLSPEDLSSPVVVYISLNLAMAFCFAGFAAWRRKENRALRNVLIASCLSVLLLLAAWFVDWTAERESFQDLVLIAAWALGAASALLAMREQSASPLLRNMLVLAVVGQGTAIAMDFLDDVNLGFASAHDWIEYAYVLTGMLGAAAYQLAFLHLAFARQDVLIAHDAIPSRWSQHRVERMLQTHDFGYQRIELPYGLATPGKARTATLDKILPRDLTGKTLADLGCNHGYFCFAAARRGAAAVTGYDLMPAIVKRARLLNDCLGTDVRFEARNLNRPLNGSFDIVLCLNVIHHLADPLKTLDNLVSITSERLVLEVAGLNLFDYLKRLRTVPFLSFLLASTSVIYIGRMKNGPGSPEGYSLKYYITRKALLRLLGKHSNKIAEIETVRSGYKGRYLVICHMRQDAKSTK